MSKPIALSNTQLDTIFRLAGPLPPPDREAYLREVAAAVEFAHTSPLPEPEAAYADLYADTPEAAA